MNKALSILGVLALVIGMAVSGAAQSTNDDSDNSTVTVEVDSRTAIDISPNQLDYTNGTIVPGDSVRTTADSFSSVEIENIGSNNITYVWMNASTPADDPFGTGLASEYNAGNFMQINSTGEITGQAAVDDGFSFVNRKEFNESNDLSYVFTPNETWRYGRFRSGDQEHFWAVAANANGECSTESNGFRVGRKAHNKTDTGSTDFTTASEYDAYTLTSVSGSQQYIAPGVNVTLPSGDNRTYDVLVQCGDPFSTIRTQYNPNANGTSDLTTEGGYADYMLDGTASEAAELQPGEHFEVETRIEVPQGVASGTVSAGRLRVIVDAS